MTVTRIATLALTTDEVLHLWERTRQVDQGTAEQPLASVYPTILKLASALCEMAANATKKEGTVALTFTEAECWLLRERVSVYEKTTDPAFGLKLTLKIATALLSFDAPLLTDADADAPDLQVTEAQRAAIREQADPGGDSVHA